MTALQQLWLASGVGAVVFFAAGLLLGAARRRGGVADTGDVEQIRRQLAQAEARTAGLQDELAVARTKTRTAIAPSVPPPIPADPRVHGQLATAERELAARTAQLRDASGELEVMKARVGDAEAMRTDYVRLRTQANEMEFLTKEVARLKEELRSAKSFAIGGVQKIPRTNRPSTPPPGSGSITDALSSAIERFSDPKMRCIAIADNVGFPVSSYGDDGAELAGYAALLNDVASRAHQFLPVATPASIEMIDEHGARITVWPFDVADERLLLVNLGVGATDAPRVERMLSEVVGILAPSVSPSASNPGLSPRP